MVNFTAVPVAALLTAAGLAPEILVGQIQMSPEMPVDPEMPRKEGFDAERAFLGSAPTFTPFHDPSFESLEGALARGDVQEDTPLLVFAVGNETLALVTAQMSYHHVAQGEMAGEAWVVTF